MTEIVIVGAKRTPIGKFGGALRSLNAVELAVHSSKAVIQESSLDPNSIDYAVFGNVLQANNGQNPARQIACQSGVSQTCPAMTVNEVCGSGLKAIILGVQTLKLNDASVALVGGTESMSNAPYYLSTERWGARYGHQQLTDSILKDGLTDAFNAIHMGITAENVAVRYGISRQDQDEFALYSQQKAEENRMHSQNEIAPLTIKTGKKEILINKDEGIRSDISLEKLATLKPAFTPDGTVTAGNASTLNDGAASLLLTTREYAIRHQLPILASIIDYAEVGTDPNYMGFAPFYAVDKLCQKTGLTLEQFDCIEANEAFASQCLAVVNELGLDVNKVNIFGGAIALGHPIGASGARIVVTLLNALKQTQGTYGLATLCVGGGIGIALAIKNEQG